MGKAAEAELIVGAGTHLDTHTAALCDVRGRTLSQLQVAATGAGYARLVEWADTAAAGRPVAWAIEGTRHYGLGLARYLAASGRQVAEIDATRHVGRRRAGKSDPIDAVRAARELLARPHPAQMRADGEREILRLLMPGRDNAVASAKTARTVLASVLVTAPAAPTGTASTASETASSTAPCTPSPSAACAAMRKPRPTSSAAAPKERPTGRSAAA